LLISKTHFSALAGYEQQVQNVDWRNPIPGPSISSGIKPFLPRRIRTRRKDSLSSKVRTIVKPLNYFFYYSRKIQFIFLEQLN
jgi:hypothetical protein